MEWSRYLEGLPSERYDQLVTALTLGVGHLQRAVQVRQADRPLTVLLGTLATAYAALTVARSLLEAPTITPTPAPVPWGALADECLQLSWPAYLAAHPTVAPRLGAQLTQATAAGVAAQHATATDAPVAEVMTELQTCLRALEGLRQLLADDNVGC